MNQIQFFAVLNDGTVVEKITLRCGDMSCAVLTYGGTLQSLCVPGADGQIKDVVLGFDTLDEYQNQTYYIGALIGRYANRIAGGRFVLNGKEYVLNKNNGENHLHGGNVGFDKRIWTVEMLEDDRLTLSLTSPDGEEGYPGTMQVKVTYRLTGNALCLDYEAVCDQDTICNLTNHAYFNLSGHDGHPVIEQELQILGDYYMPTDCGLIPLGELTPVDGTPMDLRLSQPIGEHIGDDFEQLTQAGGYDHNWVVNEGVGRMRRIARAYCEKTGIAMDVETTLPGVQLFVSQFPDGFSGKGGTPYSHRQGFCLETQFYPDSPNHPEYPSVVLTAGEAWKHRTVYRFSK